MSYRILLFRFHSVPINLPFLRIINIDGLDCAILLHHDFSDYIYVYRERRASPFQLNDGRMTKANKKRLTKLVAVRQEQWIIRTRKLDSNLAAGLHLQPERFEPSRVFLSLILRWRARVSFHARILFIETFPSPTPRRSSKSFFLLFFSPSPSP